MELNLAVALWLDGILAFVGSILALVLETVTADKGCLGKIEGVIGLDDWLFAVTVIAGDMEGMWEVVFAGLFPTSFLAVVTVELEDALTDEDATEDPGAEAAAAGLAGFCFGSAAVEGACWLWVLCRYAKNCHAMALGRLPVDDGTFLSDFVTEMVFGRLFKRLLYEADAAA